MHLFLTLIYIGIFSLLILKLAFFTKTGIKRRYLVGAFYIKVVFGLLLGWVYNYHYEDRRTGDALRFFDDASIIYGSLEEDPGIYWSLLTGINSERQEVQKYYMKMSHWERQYNFGLINDNATIIRANAMVMLFSLGHYHVHTVFWCFFSFLGLTAIFKILASFFPRKKWAMYLSVYLLPSVLFWGSGVLKEGILLFGMGGLLYSYFRWYNYEGRPKDLLVFIFSLMLMIYSKSYVLAAIVPALLALTLIRISGKKRYFLKFLIPHALLLLIFLTGSNISKKIDYAQQMKLKRIAFIHVAEDADASSLIETPEINSAFDILLHSPGALTRTYLRPWPWEFENYLYLPAIAENLFLLFCILIMIWNFKKPMGPEVDLVLFALSFVVCLGFISGSVVPVLGALVRYKVPALIFLFVCIFACTDHLLLQRRLPVLRKFLRRL